ncbi:putative Fe2OG dioxygenase domain-containing protein [Seiridium cardinale]|uniref:Fe2OG dioxygenase domain-containing protein n=1 Tax=Seiridium cardinale TaxID=138064 RepID=A0ABR2XW84_9PEZI
MASEKLFIDVPPFPEEAETAPIHTIPLADLRAKDGTAAKKLLAACQELGFFLLDLRNDEIGEAMTEEIDQLFGLGKDLFNIPREVMDQYPHEIPKSFLGFKPRGQVKTETDEPDRFEWFNMGQDGLMGTTPMQQLPPLLKSHLPIYQTFLKHGQAIVADVCSTLATQLGLPEDTFTSRKSPSEQSGTVVRITKSFASPDPTDLRTSMTHHSDFGTVTLLANVLGGLQILAPGKAATDEDAWLWVRPQPGCLIVNLGDVMVQWTAGLLRSNVHRVYYAPGQQRFVDRYSLALLVRPQRNASMRRVIGNAATAEDVEDENLTAWEWEVKKTMALKRGDAIAESKGGRTVPVESYAYISESRES